jgi:hypothetical protein
LATVPSKLHVPASAWWLVLCIVGLDYFSTLAYLPSIALEAAGPLAPLGALAIVLVTLVVVLPVYAYVVGRSPHGQGATGLLDRTLGGWPGKILVLSLMGFVAADFVVTRSLSIADASTHITGNPLWQNATAQLDPAIESFGKGLNASLWNLVRPFCTQRIGLTLAISILSFAFWLGMQNGFTRRVLHIAAVTVCSYMALTGIVIASGIYYLAKHPNLVQAWLAEARDRCDSSSSQSAGSIALTIVLLALVSFPQLALGISGFELSMMIAPLVKGDSSDDPEHPRGRIRNTRKLMFVAALIMGAFLVGSVAVTTALVDPKGVAEHGAAQHRALAYLAHGGTLIDGQSAASANPLFGSVFGTIYDLSTVLILALAGASVMASLNRLVPQYLHRTGMELDWAYRIGLTMHVSNTIILIVIVVFHASVAEQQWAYATSVLVLLGGGAIAALADVHKRWEGSRLKPVVLIPPLLASGFLLSMAAMTVFINRSGLVIALLFVVSLMATSFVSRWIRSTELRFQGFAFADPPSEARWKQICGLEFEVLVPHRPGQYPLPEKDRVVRRKHRLSPETPVIFIEVQIGDPSDFYHRPVVRFERENDLEVMRVSHCVSVSHVIAAIGLEFARVGKPPEIIFGWSHERPLAANLNFLLFGEGNIPWMVQELIRASEPDSSRRPRIVLG